MSGRFQEVGMRREHLRIPGTHCEDLEIRLESPEPLPSAWALFAHGNLQSASWISLALVERGIAVLRLAGDSPDDLVVAAKWLRGEREAPRLLLGHGAGGTAALVAAERIPECAAVATIAAPSAGL